MTVQGILPNEFLILASIQSTSLPGTEQGSRVAQLDNIGTAAFVPFSNVQPYSFPASPIQMQVVSSSASDTAAGTGAQQVEITYLTSPLNSQEPFKKKKEIVTLNGVAAVNTLATDIFRIDRFRVSRVGVTQFSAGNIFLQTVGGATIFERIDVGTNVFRTAVHFVPKGMGSLFTEFNAGVTTSGGVIFIIEETELDPSGNAVVLAQHQVEFANGSIHQIFDAPHAILNTLGKEMFFVLVVKGRAANQQASGSFKFVDFPLS